MISKKNIISFFFVFGQVLGLILVFASCDFHFNALISMLLSLSIISIICYFFLKKRNNHEK